MRQRNFNYSKHLHLSRMDQDMRDILEQVRNMNGIRSVAWHVIEGVERSLDQVMIRVEDDTGQVNEFALYYVFLDTDAEKKNQRMELSIYLYNLIRVLNTLGLMEKVPFLTEIYNNVHGTVNDLRQRFPYTGQHEFNLYYDGSIINPWKDPERIY